MSDARWGFLPAIVVGGSLLAGAVGCGKVSEASPDRVSAAPLSTTPSAPLAEGANYAIAIVVKAPCHQGQACSADVTIEAKGDYHINDKYPYKFKAQDPPTAGLKYPKPVLGKEDGQFEEKKGVLKVPFIAD